MEREQRIRQLNAALHRANGSQGQAAPIDGPSRNHPNAIEYPSRNPEKLQELEKKNKHLMAELETSQKQERFLHIETRKLNEELNESKSKNGMQVEIEEGCELHSINTLSICEL